MVRGGVLPCVNNGKERGNYYRQNEVMSQCLSRDVGFKKPRPIDPQSKESKGEDTRKKGKMTEKNNDLFLTDLGNFVDKWNCNAKRDFNAKMN